MIMVLNYQMILFSKFAWDNRPIFGILTVSFLAGNLYVFTMAAVLVVNIGVMVMNMCKNARRKKYLKKLR
jgi:hypothetical protein